MELSLSSSPSPSLSLSFSLSQLCVYFFFTSPSLVSYQIFPNIFSHFYSLFLLLVVGLPPLLLPSDDPRRSVWCCRWLGSFVGIQDNLCWGWCGRMADKRLKNACTCKCVSCTVACKNVWIILYTFIHLRTLGNFFACDDTCLCGIFNGFCYWLLASNLILVFLISLVNCVCTCVCVCDCVCHAIFNLYSLQLFFCFLLVSTRLLD